MKKKAKKVHTTNTVRVEVIAPPQNGHIEQAIVPAQPAPPDNVEMALERANKQMYFRNQLLKLIAKQINPRDIYVYVLGNICKTCNGAVKQGNNGPYCRKCGPRKAEEFEEQLEPYLSGTGCRFVLSSAGAKFEDPAIIEKQYEGTEGPYIDFEVWVTVVTADGRCVRTMGNNPTNDDFFAKRWRWICPKCEVPTVLGYGQACHEHGQVKAIREPYYLSMQEVDLPAVKQKAMTNAWNHAVRDLGFMPNIEHLKEAGVVIGKLRRIDFNRPGSDGEELPVAASSSAGKTAAGEKGDRSGRLSPSASGTSAAAPKETTPSGGSAQPPKAASKPEDSGKPQGNAASAPHSPPQARIPNKVVAVSWTKTKAGLEVTLDTGKKLYCFDNRKMGEDGEKLFDVLLKAQGKMAIFLTMKNKTKGGNEFTNIIGCVQLGDREWLEDGTPVIQRDPPSREPGDEQDSGGLFS
jgi:hypothetical protein